MATKVQAKYKNRSFECPHETPGGQKLNIRVNARVETEYGRSDPNPENVYYNTFAFWGSIPITYAHWGKLRDSKSPILENWPVTAIR